MPAPNQPPTGFSDRPVEVLDRRQLAELELLARGWVSGPVRLALSHRSGPVELRDHEGVLIAIVHGRPEGEGGLAEVLEPEALTHPPVHHDHADLRRDREAVVAQLGEGQVVVVAAAEPVTTTTAESAIAAAEGTGAVLLLTLAGPVAADDAAAQTAIKANRLVARQLRSQVDRVAHVVLPITPTSPRWEEVIDRIGPAEVISQAPAAGPYSEPVQRLLSRRQPPLSELGLTVFFTGLSGSGKSTVASAVMARLHAETDRTITLLDGDLVRQHLSSELTFSKAHRDLNITRIGFVAAEVTKHRGIAICAPIAPYDAARQRVRQMVEAHGTFVLVHVSTPLEVCEQRDRKGLYAKARAGLIDAFTGISDPYEEPVDADLRLDTTDIDTDEAAEEVMRLLRDRGLIAEEGVEPR